ncbi:hypothetical protein J4403_03400 [Candidatus Woesearchaeota archaeon]|nr:hypothetical protein [Candidatus Woesearchaeota archaeon]
MFKKVLFWSEFPNQVDWKKANKYLKKLKCKTGVYIASQSLTEYKKYSSQLDKHDEIGIWIIIPKEKGYWFSGATPKEEITKLKKYKNLNIKIDLEPPIPKFKYSNLKMLFYIIKLYFMKYQNSEYLHKTISEISKDNKIMLNEFLAPKFYLKKTGCYYENKNITKNVMFYNTIEGKLFIPFLRKINTIYIKSYKKQYPLLRASVGLIGKGILKNEGVYPDETYLKKDLEVLNNLGLEEIVIYSLESMLKRNPEKWLKVINQFCS